MQNKATIYLSVQSHRTPLNMQLLLQRIHFFSSASQRRQFIIEEHDFPHLLKWRIKPSLHLKQYFPSIEHKLQLSSKHVEFLQKIA